MLLRLACLNTSMEEVGGRRELSDPLEGGTLVFPFWAFLGWFFWESVASDRSNLGKQPHLTVFQQLPS